MNNGAINSQYFESYEDFEIHRLMLEDAPRTEAYKEAILGNIEYFKDKIVMDIGCGTGILSIFCAQAGARKVYAVEASNVANLAKTVVKENNFEEIIEVMHCKVEDLMLTNNVKVDVIVSEWMGFYLLHEGMLDSVLVARDRFLKEDGHLFPESAAIYVAPCSVPSLYKKWDNIYNVSMSSFGQSLRQSKYNKPEIMTLSPEDLLGSEEAMAYINLKEDKITDLDLFSIQHVIAASRGGDYQGICVWFDCWFPDVGAKGAVTLSTGPRAAATHWRQSVVVLPQSQPVEAAEPIAFQLDMKRDAEHCRRYNLEVTLLDAAAVEHPVPCACDMTKCIVIRAFMQQHPERGPPGDLTGASEGASTLDSADKRPDTNGVLEDVPIEDD